MKDHLTRLVSTDGFLRASAALTTGLVEEIRQRQGTDPAATVALGRLVTGAALFGTLIKEDQRLALTVEGSGPLKRMHAETDARGHVRATVRVPVAGLPLREGKLDVAGAVGRAGFLHVVKDLGLKEPYRGTVQLYSSEIAEDLAYYLTTSEQVPSSVALGVYLGEDGRVSAAGGFLIQALPGGEESLVSLLERRLAQLPPTTTLLREGLAPIHILERIFEDIPYRVQESTSLEYRCTCSRRQSLSMLRSLSSEELQELAEKEEGASVTCEFCKEVYLFSPEEVRELVGDRLSSTRK